MAESPASSSSSSSDSSDSESSPSSPQEQQQEQQVDENAALEGNENEISQRRFSTSSRSSSSSSSDSEEEEAENIENKRRSSRSSSETHSETTKNHKNSSPSPKPEEVNKNGNLNHEDDLSEVSDIEDKVLENSKEVIHEEDTNVHDQSGETDELDKSDKQIEDAIITDLRQRLNQKKKTKENGGSATNPDFLSNLSDIKSTANRSIDEDALDFEAEDGECHEPQKEEKEEGEEEDEEEEPAAEEESKPKEKQKRELEDGEELEEGEVSDEEEKRPEETEPRPICRFYTRGQCTWGSSCRFLHPGVTDKGNYSMFDTVRPVPIPHVGGRVGYQQPDYHDYRNERPPIIPRPVHHSAYHHDPRSGLPSVVPDGPVTESAWERGLRTAKEMMRKANKRKEQDVDFDEKKMNLTVSQEDFVDKDPYYNKERAISPETTFPPLRHGFDDAYVDSRFGRAPYEEVDAYGRSTRYRELPAHRMPHYEDERRLKPIREVIVQKVDHVSRGDEWSDPWMRSKSPGRGRDDKRSRRDKSYSSNSSYTSSSSSQSDSSSDSSRSRSPTTHRGARYHRSPVRRGGRTMRSPSPRRSRRSPSYRRSPTSKRRARLSPSPIDRRALYSPMNKRKKLSPPPSKSSDRQKGRRGRRANSTSASLSSDSDSDSSESSTSESSPKSKGRRSPAKRRIEKAVERKTVRKVSVEPPILKKRSPITIELKKQTVVGSSALPPSPTNSNDSSHNDSIGKKSNRREELLKQLKAVEDAIAKKRSKLS